MVLTDDHSFSKNTKRFSVSKEKTTMALHY